MAGILLLFGFIILSVTVIVIAGAWKIFQKAGQEGWKCLIPFYNAVVLLKIIGKPTWWILPLCVPFIISAGISIAAPTNSGAQLIGMALNIIGYVYLVWAYNMLSKSFGKTEGFTVGLIFLGFIFIPILGFGDARYLGPFGDKVAFEAYNGNNRFDFEDNKLAD